MHGITVFCFFASYLVALGLEAAQLLRRWNFNRWVAITFAGAGLFAQTAYLLFRARDVQLPPLLSSTHDWLLVLAWLAVAMYLFVELIDRKIALGVFVLPVVLLLVGTAWFVSKEPNHLGPLRPWGMLHASLLVFGIIGVIAGLVVSLMYLLQHRRLKHKQVEPEGLQLLSLERLSQINWWMIVLSVPLLTLGMATGVWMSFLSRQTEVAVDLLRWEFAVSGGVWVVMMALFVWMLSARRPAGRLVAWRTVWAAGFLLITLVILSLAGPGGVHGGFSNGGQPVQPDVFSVDAPRLVREAGDRS